MLAPPSASVGGSLRAVDAYIKAFYVPWDELPRWAQAHAGEYGRARVVGLIGAGRGTNVFVGCARVCVVDACGKGLLRRVSRHSGRRRTRESMHTYDMAGRAWWVG